MGADDIQKATLRQAASKDEHPCAIEYETIAVIKQQMQAEQERVFWTDLMLTLLGRENAPNIEGAARMADTALEEYRERYHT